MIPVVIILAVILYFKIGKTHETECPPEEECPLVECPPVPTYKETISEFIDSISGDSEALNEFKTYLTETIDVVEDSLVSVPLAPGDKARMKYPNNYGSSSREFKAKELRGYCSNFKVLEIYDDGIVKVEAANQYQEYYDSSLGTYMYKLFKYEEAAPERIYYVKLEHIERREAKSVFC